MFFFILKGVIIDNQCTHDFKGSEVALGFKPPVFGSADHYIPKFVVRYHQVLLRNEFDKNRAVCDAKEQRRLLWVGEHELFTKQHPLPLTKFARSIGIAGGVAYDRVQVIPDWVLDYWHPLEKAQYPSYFLRREHRKCEFIRHWYNKELC